MAANIQTLAKKIIDKIDLVLDENGNLVDVKDNGLADVALYVSDNVGPKAKAHAVKLAKKAIDLVLYRMKNDEDFRPSDLPELVDSAIDSVLTVNGFNYDPRDNSRFTPYKDALDYAIGVRDRAKSHTLSGAYDKRGAWKHLHIASLIEAIIRKYFKDLIKQSTSKKKATQMLNLTPAEKEEVKDWLRNHVTDIKYSVPNNDSNVYLGNPGIPEEDIEARDKSHYAVQDGWDKEINALYTKFPLLKNSDHIVDRLAANSDDTRKDMWHIAAITTFDTNVQDMPELVKRMVEIARSQSNHDDLKTMDEIKDDKQVSSRALADTIISLFDKDPDFYKHKDAPTAIETRNAFSADMPDYEPEPEAEDSVVPSGIDSDSLISDYE